MRESYMYLSNDVLISRKSREDCVFETAETVDLRSSVNRINVTSSVELVVFGAFCIH